MSSRTLLELALTILATLPQRSGVDWYAGPEEDGVLLHCVLYPGQSMARVTSLDEALEVAERLVGEADAQAVATLLDEEAEP